MPCQVLEAMRAAVRAGDYLVSRKLSVVYLGKPGRPKVEECERGMLEDGAEITYEMPDHRGLGDACYVYNVIDGKPIHVRFTIAPPWWLISGWFPGETPEHQYKWKPGTDYKERSENELPAMWRKHDCAGE